MKFVGRQKPKPGTGEVPVEVGYAGLCGNDAGTYEFESAFERMDLPTVIGHEYAGHVVEVGDSMMEFGVDGHVVERPIRGHGEYHQRHIGGENVYQGAIIAGADRNGACERFITVSKRALRPVLGDMKQQHAAVTEPTDIVARAVIENSRVGAGGRMLVEGPGPIGLLTAQVAGAQGGVVVVFGVGQDADCHLPLAEELGFETVNVADDDIETRCERHVGGVGYSVVFDTADHLSGLTTTVDEVRKGDQIILVGQTGETSIPYSSLVRAEIDPQCLRTSVYEDLKRSFRLIRDGDVDYKTLVDTRLSLFEANEIFGTSVEGGTRKPVLDISGLAQGEWPTAIQIG